MQLSKKDSLAMKGIAIIFMYVHHFYLDPERWAGYEISFFPLTVDSTVYIAKFFKICVCLFVFLTGYGMTMSIKQNYSNLSIPTEDILSYSKKRLVSLLSNFIFVYLLIIIITFPTGRFFKIYGTSGSSLVYAFIDMLGLAKLFGTPSYVGTWWYMSLAIILIILFPMMTKLYNNYRWSFFLLVILVPRMWGISSAYLLQWIPAMVLGMHCAESDLFGRWNHFENTKLNKVPSLILFLLHVLIIPILILIRQSMAGQEMLDILDGIIPVYFTYFCLKYVFHIPGLYQLLMFLGKHSMNMFLTHTFIRTIYFKDFSYGFGNAWVNVLVLLILTVLISIAIETLKKMIHFNEFVNYIKAKI